MIFTAQKWDLRGILLARHIAEGWSKDPSTKVGAVIMSPEHRPISWGYNGLPAGIEDTDERLSNREVKLAITLHAEHNAILLAPGSVEGGHLYVWPFPPCAHCAAIISQAKISRVVYPDRVYWGLPRPDRWQWSFDLGRELLLEKSVEYLAITGELGGEHEQTENN